MSFIEKKTVLFINPPTPNHRKFARNVDCAAESKGNYLMQPFDFLLLSGVFPETTEIEFIDCVADENDSKQVTQRLSKKYDLIVTAIADSLYENDLDFIKLLRKQFPETAMLCFGDALIEDYNSEEVEQIVDGIITSPLNFVGALSQFWSSREGILHHKKDLNLHQSPKVPPMKKPTLTIDILPRHSLIQHEKYRFPFSRYKQYSTVTSSWGCSYSCSYCTCASLPSIYRSAESIIRELQEIKGLGIREIYFGDKSFGIPLENTTNILKQMVQLKLNLSWSTYFNPNQFSQELLTLMRQAGCHTIIIGIESVHVNKLKAFNRSVPAKKIQDLIYFAHKIGIDVCGDFILGLPNETAEEIEQTINYSLDLGLDYASYNIVTPLPGSTIKKAALLDGRILKTDHQFDTLGTNRVLGNSLIGAKELVRLRNRAVRKFYLRPSYLLRRLMNLKSIEHFQIQTAEAIQMITKATVASFKSMELRLTLVTSYFR